MATDGELLDYEEEEQELQGQEEDVKADPAKKGYVGIHSTTFKDFLLKPELMRAIQKHGFEHPSEVQQQVIPQAILGQDVLCQAKSGMGKTAVFVISILQQLTVKEGSDPEVQALVLCHTRELAYQICHEFERFTEFMPNVKVANFFGGIEIGKNKKELKEKKPSIVVGTPGRIKQLGRTGDLNLKSVRYFVLDECDKMLEKLDMRADVQDIFKMTPHNKQVMMFSATLDKDMRAVCKKFMNEARGARSAHPAARLAPPPQPPSPAARAPCGGALNTLQAVAAPETSSRGGAGCGDGAGSTPTACVGRSQPARTYWQRRLAPAPGCARAPLVTAAAAVPGPAAMLTCASG